MRKYKLNRDNIDGSDVLLIIVGAGLLISLTIWGVSKIVNYFL